ncbi:hypothetical protein [Argonema antarcticum]|uniref:hypothetical protein n=1 Tax=Argonema antarcticum TaxID=2942763 RepID=UPI002013277A|nr:hypothetical protein [Argonema antarcticum]MCL1470453.1 hypothetical protein [Argonema antarcticum A004/B2]
MVALNLEELLIFSISMFTKVISVRPNKNAGRQPTEAECQQVLQLLNNGDYHLRASLSKEDRNHIQLNWDEACHSSARKFAEANRDKGWKRVSGYLVRKDMQEFDKIKVKTFGDSDICMPLQHHSVVQDNLGNLLEVMGDLYPLEKYVFICHPSGSLGWHLGAVYNPSIR